MEQKAPPQHKELRDLQFLIAEGLEMLAAYKSISDPETRKQAMQMLKDMAATQNGNSN